MKDTRLIPFFCLPERVFVTRLKTGIGQRRMNLTFGCKRLEISPQISCLIFIYSQSSTYQSIA